MRVRVSVEMDVPDVDTRLTAADRDAQLAVLAGEVLFCGDAPVGALAPVPGRPGWLSGSTVRLRKSECTVGVVVG